MSTRASLPVWPARHPAGTTRRTFILTPDTLIRRGSEHVETRVGDQTMMMSIAQSKYYALEGTAQRIWELLEEPRTVGELTDLLTAEYDVGRDVAARQVDAFLEKLLANGLAVQAGDAAPR